MFMRGEQVELIRETSEFQFKKSNLMSMWHKVQQTIYHVSKYMQ